MAGKPQTTRLVCIHKLIALLHTFCYERAFLGSREKRIYSKSSMTFSGRKWGRSLGRYDDGLQNVANGFTDLVRDEEVLERLEKPVGTAPKHCSGQRSSVQIRPAPPQPTSKHTTLSTHCERAEFFPFASETRVRWELLYITYW